ncbi:MAG TPA: type II toxin-antitoxin system VapC family toxin [Lacipirellulaceae bacterium]|jgi:PIN domain nuclease of toxin-antitoxin system
MRLLLDTHIFIWHILGDERLADPYKDALLNSANQLFLSVVSIWEVTVKHRLGKLRLAEPPSVYFPAQRQRHAIDSLRLDEESVVQLVNLPGIHHDPFDRMLICQAREHDLTLMTADKTIGKYPVGLLMVE